MKQIILGSVAALIVGCSSHPQDSPLSDESFLPPKGTTMAQIESVYGKVQRVLPPDAKQPDELHVYSILPRLRLRVNYDNGKNVVWSEFIHLDAKYYPISAKPDSLTPEVTEHDRKVKDRDTNELRKKIREVPWGT